MRIAITIDSCASPSLLLTCRVEDGTESIVQALRVEAPALQQKAGHFKQANAANKQAQANTHDYNSCWCERKSCKDADSQVVGASNLKLHSEKTQRILLRKIAVAAERNNKSEELGLRG